MWQEHQWLTHAPRPFPSGALEFPGRQDLVADVFAPLSSDLLQRIISTRKGQLPEGKSWEP